MSQTLREWLDLPENIKRRQEAIEKNKIARALITCEDCGREVDEGRIVGCCESGKCNIEAVCDRCARFNSDEEWFCSMCHHIAVKNGEWDDSEFCSSDDEEN